MWKTSVEYCGWIVQTSYGSTIASLSEMWGSLNEFPLKYKIQRLNRICVCCSVKNWNKIVIKAGPYIRLNQKLTDFGLIDWLLTDVAWFY